MKMPIADGRSNGRGGRCRRRRPTSAKGEKLAQAQCVACHGKDFVTPVDPTYPKLAGQYPDYLEKALRDYQSGARKNPIMAGIAKPLSRADIREPGDLPRRSAGPARQHQALALRAARGQFQSRRGAPDSRGTAASSPSGGSA